MTFTLTYKCLVMRPFRGEVVDCDVVSVNKVRRLPYLVGFTEL